MITAQALAATVLASVSNTVRSGLAKNSACSDRIASSTLTLRDHAHVETLDHRNALIPMKSRICRIYGSTVFITTRQKRALIDSGVSRAGAPDIAQILIGTDPASAICLSVREVFPADNPSPFSRA